EAFSLAPGEQDRLHFFSAPSANVPRLLARDHAARCGVLGRAHICRYGRSLRPCIAWCSRPRSSATFAEGALSGQLTLLGLREPGERGRGAADALVDEAEAAHHLRIEQVA